MNMKFDKGIEVFNDDANPETENIGISVEKRTPFNEFSEEIKRLSNFLDLSQVSVTSRSKPAVLLSSFLNSH